MVLQWYNNDDVRRELQHLQPQLQECRAVSESATA